jgi:hypothetical protein
VIAQGQIAACAGCHQRAPRLAMSKSTIFRKKALGDAA